MQNSGKLLILAMLAVGLVSGGVSWWFRYSATHRAVEFWGAENARLIRDAPRVELLRIAANGEEGAGAEEVTVAGEARRAWWRRDVSRAPGLTHLRTALVEDRSLAERSPAGGASPEWRWGLEFFADHGTTDRLVLYFDEACEVAVLEDRGRWVSTTTIAAGLRKVFREWVAGDESRSPSEKPLETELPRR